MTTVCYRNGILAFDSKISSSGEFSGFGIKGRKTNKYLTAGCGAYEDLCAFLDWIEYSGEHKDKINFGIDRELNISVLAVNKKGAVFQYEGRTYPFRINHKFHGIGSGSAYAIGAMEHGASAIEAVKIASKYDSSTGGRIHSLSWR